MSKSLERMIMEMQQPLSQGEKNFKALHNPINHKDIVPGVTDQDHVFNGLPRREDPSSASYENFRDDDESVEAYDKDTQVKKLAPEKDKDIDEGVDMGKPGKNFAKIAKSAAARYGSKKAGERVAGAVLKKVLAKEQTTIDQSTDMQAPGSENKLAPVPGQMAGVVKKALGKNTLRHRASRVHKVDTPTPHMEEVEVVDEGKYNWDKEHRRGLTDTLGNRMKYKKALPQKGAMSKEQLRKITAQATHVGAKIKEEALDEKHLTPAEMKKREEIAKAIARENPKMPMGKKMAIATAQAKKVAEAIEQFDEETHSEYKATLPDMHRDLKANKSTSQMRDEYGSAYKMLMHHTNKHYGVATRTNAIKMAQKHMNEEVEQVDERNIENKEKKNAAAMAVGAKNRDELHNAKRGMRTDVADKIRGREIMQGQNRMRHEEAEQINESPFRSRQSLAGMQREIALKKRQAERAAGTLPKITHMNIMDKGKVVKRVPIDKKTNEEIELDEAKRGRPSKNASAGDEEGGREHIIVQLRKAENLRGDRQVEFNDGSKHKLPLEHVKKALNMHTGMKPIPKGEFESRLAKSHSSFMSAIKGEAAPAPMSKVSLGSMKKESVDLNEGEYGVEYKPNGFDTPISFVTLGGKKHPTNNIPIEHHAEFKKKYPGVRVFWKGSKVKPPRGQAHRGFNRPKENATHFYAQIFKRHKSGKETLVQYEATEMTKGNVKKMIKHDCAKHVLHKEWGEGHCVPEMHTIVETAEGVGYVSHYDVMFEHGIEQNVPVEDLKVLTSENHGHTSAKSVKEASSLAALAEPKDKVTKKDVLVGRGVLTKSGKLVKKEGWAKFSGRQIEEAEEMTCDTVDKAAATQLVKGIVNKENMQQDSINRMKSDPLASKKTFLLPPTQGNKSIGGEGTPSRVMGQYSMEESTQALEQLYNSLNEANKAKFDAMLETEEGIEFLLNFAQQRGLL